MNWVWMEVPKYRLEYRQFGKWYPIERWTGDRPEFSSEKAALKWAKDHKFKEVRVKKVNA